MPVRLTDNPIPASGALCRPPQTAGQTATAAFLGVALLLLPLVVHNGYFDVMETKFCAFLALSFLYLVVMLILCAFRWATPPFAPSKALRLSDAGMLLFTLSFTLGALLSGTFPDALIGALNRYQGVAAILLYALLYGFLSRNFAWTRMTGAALLTGFSLAALLALLNDFGLDPLGMYRALSLNQHWQYVSTLGNTNFYSSFLGLLFPFALLLWCRAVRPVSQVFSGLALLCGVFGMLATGSESFMLAFLALLWLAPLLLAPDPRALSRFGTALCGMAVTLALLRLLTLFVPTRQYLSLSMRVLTHPASLLLLFTLGALTTLLLRKQKAPAAPWKRAYLLLSLALALLFGLALLLCNTVFAEADFGRFERFLRLNGDWGTDRGRIFAHCLDAYRAFSPVQKLFGGGPGCLYAYDVAHRLFPDAILDSAHNEYLQYLLTSGLLGLFGYLTLLGSVCALAFKKAGKRPLCGMFAACVTAYAIQAFVNIAQPISTPLFFLLLSAAAGSAARGQHDDEHDQKHGQQSADHEDCTGAAM